MFYQEWQNLQLSPDNLSASDQALSPVSVSAHCTEPQLYSARILYFLLWYYFHGFIPLISMLFFYHCLPASLALCISLRNVQPGTKFRQAADEHSCRKGRRLHARHRLVPAPMASLPYRRTGDRWSGTSGRPFDQKQPANGRPCRRHHGNQGKELPQDTRQPR